MTAVFETVEPHPPREGLVWNGEELVTQVIVDDGRRFVGHEPRQCGEHRTVGNYRAWCFDCREWCYPEFEAACARCRLARYEPGSSLVERMLDEHPPAKE